MTAYALTVVSWDSNALQTADYQSYLDVEADPLGTVAAQAVDVDRPFSSPRTVGAKYSGKAYPVHIILKGVDEAKLNTLKQWFQPSQTKKYLRCTNGAGTTLRLACTCLGLSRVSVVEWVAKLWADDATWQSDTEHTDSHLAMSGDSHAISVTNAGAKRTFPKITITPRAAKTADHSPVYYRRKSAPSSSPYPLTDPVGEGWPVMVAAGWNTAALIKTTASNQLNGAITASATTIAIDTALGGGLSAPLGGIAYIVDAVNGDEQFYYSGNSGTQLTGVVRGVGGTTAVIHGDNCVVYKSQMLKNGADVRVFVNRAEVKRWFGTGTSAINTAATKVWANIPFSAAKSCYSASVWDAVSVPADGDTVYTTKPDALAGWPPSGYFVTTATAYREIGWYSSRTDGAFIGIKRAQKGTTKRVNVPAAPVYLLENDIHLLYGWGSADAPPDDANYRPIIDLDLSTNALWAWPSDYCEPGSKRTAQWQAVYDPNTAFDANLRGYESGGKLYIEEDVPAVGKPQKNAWVLPVPVGIAAVASAITHDVYASSSMLLRLIGTDIEGNESTLAEYNADTDGDGKQITPAGVLTRLRYEGLVRTITGSTASGGTPTDPEQWGTSPYANCLYQKFTLAQDMYVYGWVARLKRSANGTGEINWTIGVFDDWDSPTTETAVSAVIAIDVDATITEAFANYTFLLTTPVLLAAGHYYLRGQKPTGIGTVQWDQADYQTATGPSYHYVTAGSIVKDPEVGRYFSLLGDGSVCQPEVPTGTGDDATVDNIALTLQDFFTGATFIAEAACYLLDCTITNSTTGQSISLKVPLSADGLEPVEIDCAAKTVIHKLHGESVAFCITAGDPDEWLGLDPGANSLVYAEPGMTNTDLVITYRDEWP